MERIRATVIMKENTKAQITINLRPLDWSGERGSRGGGYKYSTDLWWSQVYRENQSDCYNEGKHKRTDHDQSQTSRLVLQSEKFNNILTHLS